jgi:hypothetical protein
MTLLRASALAAIAGFVLEVAAVGQQQKPGAGVTAATDPIEFTATTGLTASPATISFIGADPDSGLVRGSATTTVTWTASGGSNKRDWTLSVNAQGAALSCPVVPVPVSAIQVTCATARVPGGSGACQPAFGLSTSSTLVAGGKEGNGTRTYTVTINFTFKDEWKYAAVQSPPCAVSLNYTSNTP